MTKVIENPQMIRNTIIEPVLAVLSSTLLMILPVSLRCKVTMASEPTTP